MVKIYVINKGKKKLLSSYGSYPVAISNYFKIKRSNKDIVLELEVD